MAQGSDPPSPDHSPDAAADTAAADAADAADTDAAGAADTAGDDSAVPDGGVPTLGWAEPALAADSAPPLSFIEDDDPSDEFDADDFVILGGEAAVPQRDYGPPIESVLPDPSAPGRALRELERRVRARATPAFPIEHRRRLPLEFLWKRYRRLAMYGRSDAVDEFGRDPAAVQRYEPLFDFLYRSYFRVATTGIEHVPDTGRVILVANHAGTLPYDALMIMHAMRREHPARRDARPLIEDGTFHFPYVGTFMSRVGGVRACPDNAERLLAADLAIVVFPEGQKGAAKLYRDRYRLQRFGRGGFVKLALRSRSPIVPVAIVGSEETAPVLFKAGWLARTLGVSHLPITPLFPLLGPLGLAPLPSKWTIRFGPIIDVAADHEPAAADDRRLVIGLADEIRATIQGMVADSLTQRRSVLFG